MKLHLSQAAGINGITAYGEDYVQVNLTRYGQSLIVLPDAVHDWPVPAVDCLTADHFASLAALQPEMVLLGTGRRQRFPAPALYAGLLAAGIGLEVMDTGAACRTFNILAAEGRRIAAALIVAPAA
jgi:uncharacterized protein